jgi:hypothetical protein
MMNIIITTTQSGNADNHMLSDFIADSGFTFVPRGHRSLESLVREYQAEGIIVWESTGPVLYHHDQKLFFHPSMAKNRIAAFRKRQCPDLMVKACNLCRGDDFLDCTLGLGADSIVAAFFSATGKVTGLESSPAIAFIIKWGMRMYSSRMPWLDHAIKRIEVIKTEYNNYLSRQPDKSYDIVYLIPCSTIR